MTGFPGGSFKRRVAHYGRPVEFVNEAITADESSDWNDEDIVTTSTTVDAVVQKQRTGTVVRDAEGDEVAVDAAVFVHDDDLDGFEIRGGEAGGPTTIHVDEAEYLVVAENVRPNGVHEIETLRT